MIIIKTIIMIKKINDWGRLLIVNQCINNTNKTNPNGQFQYTAPVW